MNTSTYQIRLPQFEGPFDLLLFFIERDELDIYNIPITRITRDFLDYLEGSHDQSMELSSEFILFVSTLMRIKAKMLLPRREKDGQGNEIDPRQELVDKILEYKRFKEASAQLAQMEAERLFMVKRGNLVKELGQIGEESSEGSEIQSITLFRLMKVFEKVMQRMYDRNNRPRHVVYRYRHTMEGVRSHMLERLEAERVMTFEKVFEACEDRMHAIFLFLTILELSQQRWMTIMAGEGPNSFILTWNESRAAETGAGPDASASTEGSLS